MAAHPTGPGRAGGLEGDGPGRDRIIDLSSRRPPMAPGAGAAAIREGASATIHRFGLQLTADDHAALAAWACGTGHGYDRLQVERNLLEGSDWAGYALVYAPGQAWATWGMTRRDNHVEVWWCGTGQTVGRHARMADALACLPHAADHGRAPPTNAGRAGMRMGPRRHGTR